jgi:hypothetical protein
MVKIVDNFFDNPYEIREMGLLLIKRKVDCILNDDCKYYPGVRVDCPQEIKNFIQNKIETNYNKKVTNIVSSFHITSNIHGLGLVHHDSADYASLIYLNPDPPKHSGTAFYHSTDNMFAPRPENYHKSTTTKNIEEIESFVTYKKNYNQKLPEKLKLLFL